MSDERKPGRGPAIGYLVTGLVLVALSCGLGFWIFTRGETPFAIDTWWNALVAEWYSPVLTGFSRVMNWLGGGWFGVLAVPIGGAVALIVVRRPWAAAYFLAAEAVSAGGVQALKHLFGRVRPEDIIVVTDHGSYPSGHVANATTLAVALFVIFPRVWVAVVGAVWVVLMAFSRTYLHAHWLSDTVGGALLGAGAALLVAAAFAVPMAREKARAVEKAASLG
ncbi:phosphatase PAP2 family protein [Microbacterium sp. SSM24]|uniref:phosphatase PAP2 family protein n=1 Tax=Microbacterium sp. SSM24 TaxID=2991714 RepID=UPI0022276EF5|nr:phosphatase PAP2 family protein [Microbacterium sp. SSM24]MCW3492161.1 phosphatase PAP2 family protein [Microbacterium sp. SSM24]